MVDCATKVSSVLYYYHSPWTEFVNNWFGKAGNSPSDEDGAPPDNIIEEDNGISIGYIPTDDIIEVGITYDTTDVVMIWIFEHRNGR